MGQCLAENVILLCAYITSCEIRERWKENPVWHTRESNRYFISIDPGILSQS